MAASLSPSEVEETLAAIRRRVRARHGLAPDAPDGDPDEGRGALGEALDAAHISAHLPIGWDVPIAGRGLALTKRVVRLLLRWYINPIVDQQNDFNAAVARALAELSADVERLKAEVRSTKYEQRAGEGADRASPSSGEAREG